MLVNKEKFRRYVAEALFAAGDATYKFHRKIHCKISSTGTTIVTKLPKPIAALSGAFKNLAAKIDVYCPDCGSSPTCLPWCEIDK